MGAFVCVFQDMVAQDKIELLCWQKFSDYLQGSFHQLTPFKQVQVRQPLMGLPQHLRVRVQERDRVAPTQEKLRIHPITASSIQHPKRAAQVVQFLQVVLSQLIPQAASRRLLITGENFRSGFGFSLHFAPH
jgi:hypothetical protein